jgi:hypothetical protein
MSHRLHFAIGKDVNMMISIFNTMMICGVPVALCRSRLLFTSRNKAAQGLRLANITEHCVGSLPEDAAERVLLADGVQLTQTSFAWPWGSVVVCLWR